jgi:hypothetical protein
VFSPDSKHVVLDGTSDWSIVIKTLDSSVDLKGLVVDESSLDEILEQGFILGKNLRVSTELTSLVNCFSILSANDLNSRYKIYTIGLPSLSRANTANRIGENGRYT